MNFKNLTLNLSLKNNFYHLQGFSLLEFLTVLMITVVLLTISIPNFNKFLMREERETALCRLTAAIDFAKQEAIFRGKTVTLCSSQNNKTCTDSHNWSNGYIAVIEKTKAAERKAFERTTTVTTSMEKPEILQVFAGVKYGYLHFNHFGPQHLHILPNGMTENNGTFTYCPKNADAKEADGVIINKAVRSYRPTRRNSLGILLKEEKTKEGEYKKDATPLACQ